jgi:hypothetical protein
MHPYVRYINRMYVYEYNNNNIHADAPFTFDDDTVIIDHKYYNKIKGSWLEDKIKEKYDIQIGEENMDIKYGKESKGDEKFMYIYNMMLFWYDAHHWADTSEEIRSISLTKSDMEELRKLCEVYDKFKICLIQNLSISLQNRLATLFEIPSTDGYFIKTGISSVKHDFRPYKVHNVLEGITQLLESKKIRVMWMDTHPLIPIQSIVLTKWKENIEPYNEFRVFVENGEIIGISQQCIYEIYPEIRYLVNDPEDFYSRAQNLWNNIYGVLGEKFKYKDAVLDIYVDTETGDHHLIEINAIGGWGPAGSALYNWVEEPPSKNNKEIRLTI